VSPTEHGTQSARRPIPDTTSAVSGGPVRPVAGAVEYV
jgi:hypothetical protein